MAEPAKGASAPPHEIRRVLVALDPMAQCQGALETAARLAARSEAELVGLFVEESELLAAAALPVTRVLRSHDLAEEALDEAVMARGLRAWAAHAEALLAAAAERWRIRASFRVARGRISEVLSAEARRGDLVALGAVARPSRAPRVGATARALSRGLVCPVLVMGAPDGGGAPVLAVFDGDPRVLSLGAELAALLDSQFEIVVAEEAQEAAARAWLEARGLAGRIERIEDGTAARLQDGLRRRRAGLVVLDRGGRLGAEIDAETLLLGPAHAVVVLG